MGLDTCSLGLFFGALKHLLGTHSAGEAVENFGYAFIWDEMSSTGSFMEQLDA